MVTHIIFTAVRTSDLIIISFELNWLYPVVFLLLSSSSSSETFLCSVSALQLKTVLLLDAHQLLMLVCRDFDVFKQISFPVDIFYNNCSTIYILGTNYIQLYKLYEFPDLVSCLFVFVLNVFFSF
jgi:hypothetical protein